MTICRQLLRRGAGRDFLGRRQLWTGVTVFEDEFQKACEEGVLPGVVLLASDAKGIRFTGGAHI